KKLDEAIACFNNAIELEPKKADYHINLGYALGLQGKVEEAVAAYEEALRLRPEEASAHHAFACFLRDIKHDYEGAITSFNRAINLDPKNANAHRSLAWLLATCSDVKFRDLSRAVVLAKKAVELAPNDPAYFSTLGVAHYRVGDWKA